MPVFENNEGQRVLFVHVPKCGGSSIEHWFSHAGYKTSLLSETLIDGVLVTPQHLSFNSIRRLLGDHCVFDYAFSFVRNPYERIESEYFFRYGNTRENRRPDFSRWVLKSLQVYKRYPQYLDNHFRPQTYFIGDGIDVFKLEDGMEQGLSRIARVIGVETPIPETRVNVSQRDAVVWSRRARQKVNEIYHTDFVELGYDKVFSFSKKVDAYAEFYDSVSSRLKAWLTYRD